MRLYRKKCFKNKDVTFTSILFSYMPWRTYLRRTFYAGLFLFLLYIIFFRRRSPRVFLTASNVRTFTKQNNINKTYSHRIPRIIHQTWKTNQVPVRWNRTVESVRQLNINQFEYRLWTDDDMHKFVREEDPYLYKHTFLTYPLDIQRVDAFRYIVLHRLGGLYIDMDNGCSQPFDSLLNVLEALDPQSPHLAAFPRTTPTGVSNGFMISTKGHPLFKTLISRLSIFNQNYLVDYLTVMMSAGPLFLTLNEFYFDTSSEQSAIRVIDEIVYSSIYTWHTPGSSWHGKDARVILYIYNLFRKQSQTIYNLILIIAFILILLLCRYRFRRQRKEF
jgi:mannosyltransferase OCH1-like enzyme